MSKCIFSMKVVFEASAPILLNENIERKLPSLQTSELQSIFTRELPLRQKKGPKPSPRDDYCDDHDDKKFSPFRLPS